MLGIVLAPGLFEQTQPCPDALVALTDCLSLVSRPDPPVRLQTGRRKARVTILSGSIVRTWAALEGTLARHEHSLSRSDRTMRAVHVSFPDGSLPLIGASRPICKPPACRAGVLVHGPGPLMRPERSQSTSIGSLQDVPAVSAACPSLCGFIAQAGLCRCLRCTAPGLPLKACTAAPSGCSLLHHTGPLQAQDPHTSQRVPGSSLPRVCAGVRYPDRLLPEVVEALRSAQAMDGAGSAAAGEGSSAEQAAALGVTMAKRREAPTPVHQPSLTKAFRCGRQASLVPQAALCGPAGGSRRLPSGVTMAMLREAPTPLHSAGWPRPAGMQHPALSSSPGAWCTPSHACRQARKLHSRQPRLSAGATAVQGAPHCEGLLQAGPGQQAAGRTARSAAQAACKPRCGATEAWRQAQASTSCRQGQQFGQAPGHAGLGGQGQGGRRHDRPHARGAKRRCRPCV